MYNPSHFKIENMNEISRLIHDNPLATVISIVDSKPTISLLPLVLKADPEGIRLYGHLAKGNPHWKLLEQSPTQIIFQGSQGYITPTWYAENDVPTWNYSVVHMEGQTKLRSSYDETISALQILSDHMEKSRPKPWKFHIPDDLVGGQLTSAIVAFEIQVQQVAAKFKLSQNRKAADFTGVIKGLETEGGDRNLELRDLMLRHRKE